MMIRRMTSEDVKQVATIEEQSFSVPWSCQSFLDSIAREDTIFLVATEEVSDKIMGYIGMYMSFEEGEITNVAVSLEYRDQGIGADLVDAMQTAGRECQLERMVLEVRVSNASALSLYKKKGFKELGIRKNFYEKPVEDAMIMICEL